MAEDKTAPRTKPEQRDPDDIINQLLGEGGIDLASINDEAQAEQFSIEDLLGEAALEVSGIDLFDYDRTALPAWFPDALREYASNENLKGVYDPYLGDPGQAGDERVYFGEKKYDAPPDKKDVEDWNRGNKLDLDNRVTQQPVRPEGRKKNTPNTMSTQQAANLPFLWDEKEVSAAMKKMRKAGVSVTTFDRLERVWGSLVDRASNMYSLSQGKRKVTPWDVLELSKREAVNAGNFTNFEDGTRTRTATSVSEIDEGASWQVLQQTLSSLLGRDPTDEELRDYSYRMNSLAAKNPSITESITRFKAGEAVSSESSTTGGFDADDMAQDAYAGAQDDPDYGAYQAATTYFGAAVNALGAIGDV